jgi:hypothetical protein
VPGRQLALDGLCEGMLGQALLQALLRQDAGQQAGFGLGQEVRRRAAVAHHRRIDRVQLGVGAQPGELRRPVAPRHGAEGLVVVPEEGGLAHWTQDNRSRVLGLASGMMRPLPALPGAAPWPR